MLTTLLSYTTACDASRLNGTGIANRRRYKLGEISPRLPIYEMESKCAKKDIKDLTKFEELTKFAGSWILVRSENVEELLLELGIPFILRQLVSCSTCCQYITVRGMEVDIVYDVGFCVNKMTIKIGEVVEVTRLNVKHKCSSLLENGKLMVTQTPIKSDVKEQIIYREIIDSQLVMTVYVGSVVCKRYFRRKTEDDELPAETRTINCDSLYKMLSKSESEDKT